MPPHAPKPVLFMPGILDNEHLGTALTPHGAFIIMRRELKRMAHWSPDILDYQWAVTDKGTAYHVDEATTA